MVRSSYPILVHLNPVLHLALQFDPDRFLDDRLKKYLINNPFIFLPFNAGPRICLGQQVRLPFSYRLVHGFTVSRLVRIQRDVVYAYQVASVLFIYIS